MANDKYNKRPAAIRVGAVVDKAFLAEEALAAEGLNIDSDPVTDLYGSDRRADLLYNSYHLVADGNSLDSTRHRAVFDVQVAGADTRKRYPDDSVGVALKRGSGFFDELKIAFVYVCVCKHCVTSFLVICLLYHISAENPSIYCAEELTCMKVSGIIS